MIGHLPEAARALPDFRELVGDVPTAREDRRREDQVAVIEPPTARDEVPAVYFPGIYREEIARGESTLTAVYPRVELATEDVDELGKLMVVHREWKSVLQALLTPPDIFRENIIVKIKYKPVCADGHRPEFLFIRYVVHAHHLN